MSLLTRLFVFAAVLFNSAAVCAQTPAKRQVGGFLLEDVPVWEPSFEQHIRPCLAVRPTELQDVQEDARAVLITTRFGNVKQLHLVSRPLGARRQLTFFDKPVLWAAFAPGSQGRRLVFLQDPHGTERWQLYELDLDTNRTRLLTDGVARHESPVLSNDGRLLAFCGTGRNGRDYDVYVYDLTRAQPARMVQQAEGMLNPVAFSPDNADLLVQAYTSERQTAWFVLTLADKRNRRITPETPACFYGGGAWGADGRHVYLFSDRQGPFRKLYRLSLDNGVWRCLTPDIDWDVEAVRADPVSGRIAFVTNEAGVSGLYVAAPDGAGRTRLNLPGDHANIANLIRAPGGQVFGVTLGGSRTAADAYTASFSGGRLQRWTHSETGGWTRAQLCATESFDYPTFDRVDGRPRRLPAFIMRGRGKGPRPVVIHAHGGPEYQYKPHFSTTFQYWAAKLGITVISPNIRGSTGYGRAFHQLDNGVRRADAVRDIGALLDWIDRQPDLDHERVGIFGGSYGGYLVLGALRQYPRRVTCGIDVVGVADFVQFLEQTSAYRRDLRRVEYGDERDPRVRKVLEAISPLRHAADIKAPLFVLHGLKDTRVPIDAARQIVAALRNQQQPVWFATALDEGHVFHKRETRDLADILYCVFWRKYLLP